MSVVLLVAALSTLLAGRSATPDMTVPTPTTTSTTSLGAPRAADIEEMELKLASGDRAMVASVLAAGPEDATDEMVARFAAVDIAWDWESATVLEGDQAWRVPTTVAEPGGRVSHWVATVVDSGTGPVFLGSSETDS